MLGFTSKWNPSLLWTNTDLEEGLALVSGIWNGQAIFSAFYVSQDCVPLGEMNSRIFLQTQI